jgi:hypothetical protein
MASKVSSVSFAALLISAATGCMTQVDSGADGFTPGVSAQAEEEEIDSGGGVGGGYPDPTIALDGSSGIYISVGWLGGGYINRGTFDRMTVPQTLSAVATHLDARVVTLVEYCQTLAMIINNNFCLAGSNEQAAMAAAWGTHCSPLGSGGGGTCN